MRLQGNDAIAQLCELLSLEARSPPGLHSTENNGVRSVYTGTVPSRALAVPPRALAS